MWAWNQVPNYRDSNEGIHLHDMYCFSLILQLQIHPGVSMTFLGNTALESGGGIYVEFPPVRFVVDIFNRLCFLQYSDGTGSDVPPQEWQVCGWARKIFCAVLHAPNYIKLLLWHTVAHVRIM